MLSEALILIDSAGSYGRYGLLAADHITGSRLSLMHWP
jgi:hypothetical protein